MVVQVEEGWFEAEELAGVYCPICHSEAVLLTDDAWHVCGDCGNEFDDYLTEPIDVYGES